MSVTSDIEPADAKLDPFDPASLRLSQNFEAGLGVMKALRTVPVRKPAKEWFVRVHPNAEFRLDTCVIELKEENETYLVAQPLWSGLMGEATFSPRALFTSMTRQNVLFLWPVRLPGSDGKLDAWSESALDAAGMAQTTWCRVTANMQLGAYEVTRAASPDPAPNWPDTPFKELLGIAFKGKYIDSFDHPVLRKLRGEE